MPDLLDIYRRQLAEQAALQQAPTVPQPTGQWAPTNLSGLGNALTSPVGLAKGVWDTGISAAEGIGQTILNGLQVISPWKVPGSTEMPDTLMDRAKLAARTATMGLADQLAQNYQDTGNISSAIGRTVYDLTPIGEFEQTRTGLNPDGTPMTPEQYGQTISKGILEAIPFLKGATGAVDALANGVKRVKAPRYTPTRAQMQASGTVPAEAVAAGVDPVAATAIQQAGGIGEVTGATEAGYTPSPLIGTEGRGSGIKGILSHEEAQSSLDNLLGKEAVAEHVTQAIVNDPTSPKTQAIHKYFKSLLDEDAVPPEAIPRFARATGLDPEHVVQFLADESAEWERTASTHGRGLAQFRRLGEDMKFRELVQSTLKMDDLSPEARKTLEGLSAKMPALTLYQNIANYYRKGVNFARAMAVSQPATAARNLKVQAGIGAMGVFEDALTDSLLAIRGSKPVDALIGAWEKFRGREHTPGAITNAWADVTSDFATLAGEMARGGKSITDLLKIGTDNTLGKVADENLFRPLELLKETPTEYARLTGSPTTGDLFSIGAVKNIADVPMSKAERVAHFATTLNRIQETELRQYAYAARLRTNLGRLGINNWDEVEGLLKSGAELPDNVKLAINDSVDHALKQTFSFSPEPNGIGKAILDTYQKIPFLMGLGPMFPRFLVNQYRHLYVERNPLNIMHAFTPEFRKNFLQAANGELGAAESARVISQAMMGTVQLTAATFIRNTKYAGPKYYQMFTGEKDKDGNPVVEDLRAYQPLTSYLMMADMAKAWGEGKAMPENLTSAELTDALTGMRNVSEVPIFAMADLVRTADANNPEALPTKLKRIGGQMIAMPFVPLRAIEDLGSALGVPGMTGQMKDTSGAELFGPMVNSIPLARNTLPNLPDIMTGKPQGGPESYTGSPIAGLPTPVARQLLGRSNTTLNPLEMELNKLGLRPGDIVGNYGDPEADRLVRKYVGSIMGLGENNPVSSRLGELFSNVQADPAVKRDLIKTAFASIRQEAVRAAMAENPKVFLPYLTRQQPEFLRTQVRDQVKESRERRTRPPTF